MRQEDTGLPTVALLTFGLESSSAWEGGEGEGGYRSEYYIAQHS